MKEEDSNSSDFEELPDVAVQKKRRLSIVWIIPVVAALIGGWLTYKTLSEKGPTVTLTFEDGAGLEAGKTKIKYKAIEIGTVKQIDISHDLSNVVVLAEFSKQAEPHLTENTRFWVVRPRLGLGGISGLETLVSGSYIAIDPRPGPSARTFTGLEKPPGVTREDKGAQFQLRAENLGSSSPGAPVFYHDIQVGRVLDYVLDKEGEGVFIDIFIQAPHHLRVRDTSRFWQLSGFEISLGAEGLNVKMESLSSLLTGGIAFDTPATAGGSDQPSQPGMAFKLFKNFSNIQEEKYVLTRQFLVHFEGSVRGLNVGAPVEFRGIKIGSVSDIAAQIDPKTLEIKIPVLLDLQPERITTAQVIQSHVVDKFAVMKQLVRRGLRAQLETGSLLTGQLFVQLDFHPDLPQQDLIMTEKYPEIPAVPATMDELRRTVTDVMAEIRRLPLDKIAKGILETVEGGNRLVNSLETQQAVHKLNAALGNVEKLTEGLDRQVDTLATNLNKTLLTVRKALQVADPNSPAAVNMNSALKELSAAARSIRVLADYLEQHPEALVKGK
ncbi:MAG TPA: MlaD family protein [Nitrospirales bacterium]|nr:paraquat-inducible protein B [Nitrospiraceae bacterium]HNP29086.1 MlaD family protein [Nitrospirales bacterium]